MKREQKMTASAVLCAALIRGVAALGKLGWQLVVWLFGQVKAWAQRRADARRAQVFAARVVQVEPDATDGQMTEQAGESLPGCLTMNPAEFRPMVPGDLIGQAAQLAGCTLQHVRAIKATGGVSMKLAFYGPPGCGKTTLAEMAAKILCNHKLEMEAVNGRDLTIDRVREWASGCAYGSLFGGWRVKVINEMDLVPRAAQDLLLSYLDELPAGIAVIGTSNESHDDLTERFCSRFQQIHVAAPSVAELGRWLWERWNLPVEMAEAISQAAGGNVREALLQTAAYLTFGVIPETRKQAAAA
jgi:replication-associated recombination protein RarA